MGRPILRDGSNDWNKMPYQIELGKEFTSMAEVLTHLAALDGNDGTPSSLSSSALADYFGIASGGNDYLSKPYYRDTRLGANDAINCIWQFNRDDDIVHPNTTSEPVTGIGLGRVYAETTEKNQTIAWFSFGVPRFTNLVDFYRKAFHADMIKVNATGVGGSNISVGNLFGSAFCLAISVATAPIRWIGNFLTTIRDYEVDKFYDFRSTMHLYYKYVDTILANWIVDTGMYGQAGDPSNYSASPEALPLALRETGPSIWDILTRKARILGITTKTDVPLYESQMEQLLKMDPETYDTSSENIWTWISRSWSDGFKQTICGATQFVGFRVEKDTDTSESWSSSTAPSAIAEKINSTIQEASSKAMDYGFKDEGQSLVGSIASGVTSFLSGLSSTFSLTSVADAAMYGAYIDIPEQYKSSEFHKSHSLSFKLRSPYGDMTSIYQSIIVPLACLLAAAMPRAAGSNSWMQPFCVRVYCPGRFSVPLGIIDNLTLKRGSSEFGWTYENLPTCVDVNMSIKDLSTAMYMSVNDSWLPDFFSANNNFKEFMLTLSGTGTRERILKWSSARRTAQYTAHMLRNRLANPMYYKSWISDTLLGTAVGTFMPMSYLPKN